MLGIKLTQHKIGLALGGGGARGFSHVGVLMAMEKFRIKPDLISGVSAGSIVAALYASGLTPREILTYFSYNSKFTNFTDITIPRKSLFKMDKFAELLEEWLPIKNIEETTIPIVICATDMDNGKSVGFTRGEIIPRVIASCSIPIIFPPVKIAGVNYVDGGVLRNLPAWAIRDKCRILFGSNCSPLQRNFSADSIIDIALRSYNLMAKANTLQDITQCDHVFQSSELANFKVFDVASMRKITIHGYDTACRLLEKIY